MKLNKNKLNLDNTVVEDEMGINIESLAYNTETANKKSMTVNEVKLYKLISNLNSVVVKGEIDISIESIAYNTKKVNKNTMFVALKGSKFDGHNFIHEAIKNGAICLVVEEDVEIIDGVTIIKVKNTRKALAKISANYFNNPSKMLNLIGITGTNGKTTTTYLLKSILEGVGKSTGIIGTIGSLISNRLLETKNTTPESYELQRVFREMLTSKVEDCIIEVSSHSLEMNRVDECDFNICLFTNLTPEHLDYHKSIKNYFKAKTKLFYMSKNFNIINMDDKYGRILFDEIKKLNVDIITYGTNSDYDIYADNIVQYETGISFDLHTPKASKKIDFNIPGIFSVYNSLAAASIAYAMDIELEMIKKGLEGINGVRGRFEVIPSNKDFTVIIDYAHEAAGFEKILNTVNKFAKGRIITVFGAGGERDKGKRPKIGSIAGKYSDLCILTTDNCRSEDPNKIIDEIICGVNSVKGNYIVILDRKEAIKHAIRNAKINDIILLLGKGHENYQIIGDEILPFDEKKIVQNIFKK